MWEDNKKIQKIKQAYEKLRFVSSRMQCHPAVPDLGLLVSVLLYAFFICFIVYSHVQIDEIYGQEHCRSDVLFHDGWCVCCLHRDC